MKLKLVPIVSKPVYLQTNRKILDTVSWTKRDLIYSIYFLFYAEKRILFWNLWSPFV